MPQEAWADTVSAGAAARRDRRTAQGNVRTLSPRRSSLALVPRPRVVSHQANHGRCEHPARSMAHTEGFAPCLRHPRDTLQGTAQSGAALAWTLAALYDRDLRGGAGTRRAGDRQSYVALTL